MWQERGRWIAVAAIAIAVLFGMALWIGSHAGAADAVAGPGPFFVQAAGTGPIAASPTTAGDADGRPRAVPIKRAEAALPPTHKASEVEICGMGMVDLEAPGAKARFERAGENANAVLVRAIDSMRASLEPRVRATGLYLGSQQDGAAAVEAMVPRPAECAPDDGACDQERRAIGGPVYARAAKPALDALIRMATTTRDPMVYAITLQHCVTADGWHQAPPDACRMVSAEQWARLDPGNASAWLRVAGAARSRKDVAAESEALRRVAGARETRIYSDRIPAMILAALPEDMSPIERGTVNVMAFGIFAAGAYPDYQTVTQFCSVETLRDANRRQICDQIASTLVDRGPTLLDLGIGLRIGERSGWPPERLNAVRMERDATFAMQGRFSVKEEEAFTCRTFEKWEGEAKRLATLGELATTRLAIRESGVGVAELAKRHRDQLEFHRQASRAAEAAERAASGAASGARE